MAKPSIFSRDYEKKMKRRRRRILITILVLVLGSIAVIFRFYFKDTDFSEFRSNIQAWIDSDKPKEEIKEINKEKEPEQVKEEKIKEPEKTYIDLDLENGVILKAEYTEINGDKKFTKLEGGEGLEFILSPSQKQILITAKNQDLKLFSIDGTMKDVTKKSYVSQAGGIYPKEDILRDNPTYLWHSQARFIDETRIAYVSQMPYFGEAAVNKYVWIYDTVNAKENAIWNLKGPDTKLEELDPVKGIAATINGVKYFINGDGVVIQ